MTNSITIKDGNSSNIHIHTIEDSTSTHFNQSIPTDSAGNVATVVSGGQAAASGHGALVIAVSPNTPLPSGTNLIGAVSVRGDVSINDKVSVSGLVGLNSGVALIGAVSVRQIVSVVFDGANVNMPVSVAGTITVGTHAVTQSGTWNVNAALTSTNNNVALTSIGSNAVATGVGNTTNVLRVVLAGNNTDKTIIGAVCIADSTIATTGGGGGSTIVTSVGGAVSVQAVPIAGKDTGGDARQPLFDTTGRFLLGAGTAIIGKVSIADSTIAVTGAPGSSPTITVSIGGNVSVQAVPVAGTDGTDARLFKTDTTGRQILGQTTDKIVIGAVSLADTTLPTHAVTQSGTWAVNAALTSTNNNVALTSIGSNAVATGTGNATNVLRVVLAGANADKSLVGAVSIADTAITINALPAGANLIGAVSVRGNIGAAVSLADGILADSAGGGGTLAVQSMLIGAEVSTALPTLTAKKQGPLQLTTSGQLRVAPSPANTDKIVIGAVSLADGTLPTGPVTQSGTWTVQIGNTANTTPVLVTVNSNIAVSVQGGILAAVSLGGGTAIIGAVSIRQIVSVRPENAIGSAIGVNAMPVGGTDGTNLVALLADTLGALKVSGFVTNAEVTFTRPADTTAYAAGDMVANDTNKNSLTPLAFPVSRFSGGGGTVMIRRARIVKSTGSLTNAQFRLHLYATSNGITNAGVSAATSADNAVYQATKCSAYLGFCSIVMGVSHNDGAVGWGVPNKGMEMSLVLPAAQFNIQGLIEARAAYAPGNAERFNTTIEVFQD